jgi:hypothetical protein
VEPRHSSNSLKQVILLQEARANPRFLLEVRWTRKGNQLVATMARSDGTGDIGVSVDVTCDDITPTQLFAFAPILYIYQTLFLS